jgi:segregation and condensation protein A
MTDEAGRGDDSDVSLNITGHEAEKARREAENQATDNSDNVDDLITDFSIADAPDSPDPDDDEVEPVELLVGLADEGEIDPWDIDIVAVTDKFLDRLDEADLRTGGRALFYASVLLRMKSDHLLEDPNPEEEAWEDPVDGVGADAGRGLGVDPFDKLEAEMDRRLERKRARGMPKTLDELVRELRDRERETWWKDGRTYDTSDSPEGYARGTQTLDYRSGDDFRMDDEPSIADVTGTAHDEHMDTVITETYTALREHYDQGRVEVLFAEVEQAGGSRVMTFLGLLFLAHRGQVRLQQDALFGDLWVQDPGATGVETEAVADGGTAPVDPE